MFQNFLYKQGVKLVYEKAAAWNLDKVINFYETCYGSQSNESNSSAILPDFHWETR